MISMAGKLCIILDFRNNILECAPSSVLTSQLSAELRFLGSPPWKRAHFMPLDWTTELSACSATSCQEWFTRRGPKATHWIRCVKRHPRRRASTRLQVLPQELDERLQRHRHLSPARIIQKDCRSRRPPVLKQGNQPPRLDL